MNTTHISRRRLSPCTVRRTHPTSTFLIGSDRLIVDVDDAGFPATVLQDRGTDQVDGQHAGIPHHAPMDTGLRAPVRVVLPTISPASRVVSRPSSRWSLWVRRVSRWLRLG